jgi:gamma-glutamyltranspeptidase / glutathione hydrolase
MVIGHRSFTPFQFLVMPALAWLAGCASETVNPLKVESAAAGPDGFATPPALAATAKGRGGAAATVDARGSLAAIEILKRGGNAIDAAVASAAVLGVTDPFSCGIGGGGFMVIYLAAEGRVVTIDHREEAPRGFDPARFYENGAPIELAQLITSGLSVGVPGTVRGWDEALRRYGTLPLSDVLERAARVAEDGFEVDPTFLDQSQRNVDRFSKIDSTRALFLDEAGEAYPLGAIFKNPDLAKTYRLIAEGGAKAFYSGEIARAIVDTVAHPPTTATDVRPGVMTAADLADYEALVRPAVESAYRGYTLYGMDLPSSGGVTVAMILNLLSGYDPASLSRSQLLHVYLEASRLAFADRGAFLGDPAFAQVPEAGLLSLDYAAARRQLIDTMQASVEAAAPGDPYAFQVDPSSPQSAASARGASPEPFEPVDRETTHLTISDADGNIVSYTCTIESEGGNGIVVPGYGFLLNNELTDFNIPADPAAHHPNIGEPGKRPRSSISPTLVFKGKTPFLALGSPGGSTIITTVTQMLIHVIDSGMPVADALAAPRISQRNSANGKDDAEETFLQTPEAEELRAMGHTFTDITPLNKAIGAATAIQFDPDGTVTAAAEPTRRNGGSAIVVTP